MFIDTLVNVRRIKESAQNPGTQLSGPGTRRFVWEFWHWLCRRGADIFRNGRPELMKGFSFIAYRNELPKRLKARRFGGEDFQKPAQVWGIYRATHDVGCPFSSVKLRIFPHTVPNSEKPSSPRRWCVIVPAQPHPQASQGLLSEFILDLGTLSVFE